MRIHPPKLVIDPQKPYSNDLLRNRQKFGDNLSKLLRRMDPLENLVVLIDAPWGAGKSTFLDMWQADLLREGQSFESKPVSPVEIIRFDAFAADHHEDPFVAFSGEVMAFLKTHRAATYKGKADDFLKKAAAVAAKLAKPTFGAVLKTATAGAMDDETFKALLEIGEAGADQIAAALEKRIEAYGKERESLSAFKNALAEVAAAVRSEQQFPLVIVVDELDRCRPDFALKLLERIKHLFEVPGVVFALFAHKAQLEEMVRHTYGREVDANAYLHKFVHIVAHLPEDGKKTLRHGDSAQYSTSLSSHYGLFLGYGRQVLPNIYSAFIHRFDLTLREVERTSAMLSVYNSMYEISGHVLGRDSMTLLLAVIKIKRQDLYRLIAKRENAYEPLVELLKTNAPDAKTIYEGCNADLLSDVIYLCLGGKSPVAYTLKDSRHQNSFGGENPERVTMDIVHRLDSIEIA